MRTKILVRTCACCEHPLVIELHRRKGKWRIPAALFYCGKVFDAEYWECALCNNTPYFPILKENN